MLNPIRPVVLTSLPLGDEVESQSLQRKLQGEDDRTAKRQYARGGGLGVVGNGMVVKGHAT